MRKNYILGMLLLLPFLGWNQSPIISYDFNGGFQGWEPNSISCDGTASDAAKWIWVADGSTEQGIYSSGFGQLDSRTPDNGIVILNSEFLDNKGLDDNLGNGDCPAPQIAELISPSLDFSGKSEVYISFSQLYLRFQGDSGSFAETSTYLAVTTDGTTWEEIEINEDVAILRTNDISQNEVTLDLSSYLAGHSNAKVKFLWRGDYYFWGVDDVRFYDSIESDLAIVAFKYPVSNYETPLSMIDTDTMTFLADVTNFGSQTVDSAYLRISVRTSFETNNRELFRDSILLENLTIGDTSEIELPNFYVPNDLVEGSYVFVYSLRNTKDVEEVNETNNLAADFFRISQNNFRKTDRGENIYYDNPGAIIIGNYFTTSDTHTEKVTATHITFSNFVEGAGSLDGLNVVVKLYKIADDVLDDFSNFNGQTENNESIKTVGIGSYVYTAADDDVSTLDRFKAELFSFEDLDSAVVLEPGTRYIAAVVYTGSSNNLKHNLGKRITYYSSLGSNQTASVLFEDGWVLGNPFGSSVAVVGLDIATDVMTANELELTETEVKIYPNPASDFVNVDASLDNPQTITTYLTDVTGRILDQRTNNNFISGTVRFNVSDYPSGTYFIKLTSEQGVKVKKIVVGH